MARYLDLTRLILPQAQSFILIIRQLNMMKKPFLAAIFSALVFGCGGNSSENPSVIREVIAVNADASPPASNEFFFNGQSVGVVVGGQASMPFKLGKDELDVTFSSPGTDPDRTVAVPPGPGRFIVFDVGPYSPAVSQTARLFVKAPRSKVRITLFIKYLPYPGLGPVDIYLLPSGVKTEDGTLFASAPQDNDLPSVYDIEPNPGNWYLWGTKPGKPRNTLFKIGPFSRSAGTSVVAETSTYRASLYAGLNPE